MVVSGVFGSNAAVHRTIVVASTSVVVGVGRRGRWPPCEYG